MFCKNKKNPKKPTPNKLKRKSGSVKWSVNRVANIDWSKHDTLWLDYALCNGRSSVTYH